MELEESFGAFIKIEYKKSEDVEETIVCIIEAFTKFSKIRGQGYDREANVNEIYQGLWVNLRVNNINLSAKLCALVTALDIQDG